MLYATVVSLWGALMKALVPVKRVIDYNVKPRVKADGTGVWMELKLGLNNITPSCSVC